MRIRQDHVIQILWCYGVTPTIGIAKVEKLLGGEALKAGQLRLNSIRCYPKFVSKETFTKATIIGYVLTLSVDAVELFKFTSKRYFV